MSEPVDLKGLLQWRCIGPFRGGRVVAVAGDCQNPNVFYFGAVAGGAIRRGELDAGGGMRALEARGRPEDRLLLEHLKGGGRT